MDKYLKALTTFFFALLIGFTSCKKSEPEITILSSEGIMIPFGTTDTLLYFTSRFDGKQIPVKIVFPENQVNAMPAVVVLHGSGGGWQDEDTNDDGEDDVAFVGELSNQNEEWAELLNENDYVAAFPESYYARGPVEARGDWDEPPLKLKINAQGPRSVDARQTLELLCSLVDENGNPVVLCDKVGLMGFSDGGTTVYSAVYNHPNATPSGYEWLYDDDFSVPAPEEVIEAFKFAAAVSKYGGGSHHGFYGSVSDCDENIYQPYCPLRVELGGDDKLTTNNLKLIACIENKGVDNITYEVYPDAPHGFDTKDDTYGPLSRTHTITYFNQYLKQ